MASIHRNYKNFNAHCTDLNYTTSAGCKNAIMILSHRTAEMFFRRHQSDHPKRYLATPE